MADGQVNIVIKATDKTGGVFKNVSGKLGGLGKLAAIGAASAVAAGGVAIAGIAAKGIMEFTKFEDQMNEVFTLLPEVSGEAMETMRGQVLDAAVDMGRLPEEVVPALYQSLSAGVPQDNVFEFLETAHKAALGGVTDLETAVDGITSVVNTYGSEVLGAGKASDLMFTAVRLGKTTFGELAGSLSNVAPLASAMGVDFEDVTAALAAMTSQGTDTATATTQMRGLLQELGDSGSEVGGVFQELAGDTFLDFVDKGGNVAEALQLLERHSELTGEPMQNLFGNVRAGLGALQLTGKGMDTFVGNLEEMQASTGATEKAFETMNSGFARTLEVMKARFETTFIKIGDMLAPFVKIIGDKLLGLMEKLEPIIENVLSGFSGFFENLQSGMDPIEALKNLISKLLQNLGFLGVGWDEVMEIMTSFQDTFDKVRAKVEQGIDTITGIIGPIFEAVGKFVSWKDILIVVGGIIGTVIVVAIAKLMIALAPIVLAVGAIIAVVALLRNAWENDWLGIKTALINVWETVIMPAFIILKEWLEVNIPIAIEFLRDAWENTLLPAIQAVWAFIQENVFPLLVVLVTQYIEGVKIGVATLAEYWENVLWPALQNVWDFIQNTLIPILVALVEVGIEIVKKAIEILAAIWENVLLPAIETVWFFISTVLIPIFEAVAEVVSAVVQKALEILAGIWENVLLPAIEAVWEFVKEKILPILEELAVKIYDRIEPALTFISGIFDKAKTAIGGMKDAVKGLIDWLGDLADRISNIKLPDWMTPGSPTPFEIGVRGMSSAISELSARRLPDLNAQLQALSTPMNIQSATGLAFGGQPVNFPQTAQPSNVHQEFTLNLHTSADVSTVIEDFELMKSIAMET
jgi:TP901 family phage tail tape measure protein